MNKRRALLPMISARMSYLRLVHSVSPVPPSAAPVDHERTASESEPSRVDRQRFDPAVQALLEHIRTIGPLPRAVRERALARARAALVAPTCTIARPPSRRRRPWLTLLVSVTLVVAAGAALEAFLTRGSADTEQRLQAAAPLRLASIRPHRPHLTTSSSRRSTISTS